MQDRKRTIVKLKLNVPLQGYREGQILDFPADANGVILDRYWRNRVRDSAIDNCVELVTPESGKTAKKA